MIRWLVATGLRMLADALEPEEPLDLRLGDDDERLNENLRACQRHAARPPLRVVTDAEEQEVLRRMVERNRYGLHRENLPDLTGADLGHVVTVPHGGACSCQLRLTPDSRLTFDLDAPCSHREDERHRAGLKPTPHTIDPIKETDS